MGAKVSWKGKMSFDGTSDSGFILPLGTDPAVGGDNDGFRPLELILVGLVGCTAMDVISILGKKRQEVTDFEVTAEADRAEEHPKVFTHIRVNFSVTGKNIDEAAVQRAIELSETKYCPAQAMLSKAVTIESSYSIQETGAS
jgi:putative redox protein